MGEAGARGLNWIVALRLGRVSNLPTMWTNVLAGLALSGGVFGGLEVVVLGLAFSLFYVAGMYLNDAFDREHDRAARADRPIPAGAVSAGTVFSLGFAFLGAGWLILVATGCLHAEGTGWRAAVAGLALAGAILFYDAWHKGNPLSPVVMGVCRVLVYVGAAVAIGPHLPIELLVPGLVVLCYLVGLTYAARQETLARIDTVWPLGFLAVPVIYALHTALSGFVALAAALAFLAWLGYALSFLLRPDRVNIPRAVVSLIAGICLLDAVFVAGAGYPEYALVAGLAFLLTLALQRHIAGT